MNCHKALIKFVSLAIYFFLSSTAHAATPVAIECPCSVSRVNPTSVEINFNLIFTQDARKSAPIKVYLTGHGSRDAAFGSYYVLASSEIESIVFSDTPRSINVQLPFYEAGFESGYLSLVLVDEASGQIFDIAPLTAQPISLSTDAGAALRSEFDKVFFENKPIFEFVDNSYALSALNFTNRSNPLATEQLTLQLTASNLNSYYLLDEQEFTLTYDSAGRANLDLQGFASSSLNAPLSYAPEHKYLQVGLYKAGQLLLFYTLATLDNSPLPDYGLELSGVDTLADSDADGVSDYVELLRGSPSNSPGSPSTAEIEVAFSYGDAVLDYYVSVVDVEAQLSHLLAVANAAYADSGLNIRLVKSALVYLGNDRGVSNNDLLVSLADRTWPFRQFDALVARQSDINVHLNTLSYNDNNGGVAWINGQWNDGVIDFDHLALRGTNTAVVDMDNTALTLVHEVGHLMGLDHSRLRVNRSHFSSFPWALGHGIDAEFVTIMGYSSTFSSAPQAGLFSSPDLVCSDLGSSCGLLASNAKQGADAVSALRSVAYQWSAVANGYTPVLTLTGTNPLMLEPGEPIINLGAMGFDAEDGDITAQIDFIQTTVSDDPDIDYLQSYTLTDSDGNSFSVTRQVIVDTDTDSDGIYNRSDSDDDNDGVADANDQFPIDSRYTADSDADGMPDLWETFYGLDLNNSTDASSDLDVDGLTAVEEFTAGSVPIASLDIDGNGQYDGLTDGLLILRFMFGFSGEQLIGGSLAADALYRSASLIEARIEGLGDRIDIDGDNQLDALTDGLLILRYLLDFQQAALIDNALSEDALRIDPVAIEAYLQTLKTGS